MIETTASKSFADRDALGSAGAAPAVFGASPKTSSAGGDVGGRGKSRNVSRDACDTAREAPALARRSSPLTWLNLLCLDAPIVAVTWQWLFARSFGIAIANGGALALFLTAWLIYLADRFGDSLTTDQSAPMSQRQRFCLRHRGAWLGAVVAVAGLDLVVIWVRLHEETLFAGAAVGASALVYLVVNQAWPHLWRWLPIKEIAIGFLFAGGTIVALAPGLTSGEAVAWFLFASLCSMNCISIAVWERELDAAQKRVSFATVFPIVSRQLLPALILLCLTSVLSAVLSGRGQSVYLFTSFSALLLGALHLLRKKIEPDVLTALADLVLLTPALALAFWGVHAFGVLVSAFCGDELS